MAVRVKFLDLESTTREQIPQHLVITPKQKFYYKTKWGPPPPKENIIAYRVVEGDIFLPYTYGKKLFSKHIIPNNNWTNTTFYIKTPPRDYQWPILNEAWQQLQVYGTTTLAIYTGAGKSFMATYLTSAGQGLSLFLCPSNSNAFIKIWSETLTKHSTANIWVVGEAACPDQVQVIICLDTRIDKIPSELLKKVKILVIDEVHSFATQRRLNILLSIEPKYIIAASATNFREDGTYIAIESMVGLHSVYKKSTKPFQVVKYNTGIEIPKFDSESKWADHNTFISQHKERNKLIVDGTTVDIKAGKKVIILCWKKEHVDILYYMLSQHTKVAQMKGGIKSYTDSNVLVGTINKIGTGFDEETVCANFGGKRSDVLVLVGSMKSIALLEQVAGRVFRAQFPTVRHFVDDNKISQDHWKKGKKWYISRNGQIIEDYSPIYMEKDKQGLYKKKRKAPNQKCKKDTYLSLVQKQLANLNIKGEQ